MLQSLKDIMPSVCFDAIVFTAVCREDWAGVLALGVGVE